MNITQNSSDSISFIVHIRRDCEKRIENFKAIYKFYKDNIDNLTFVIIEDDKDMRIDFSFLHSTDKYIFHKNDSIYQRALCFNTASKLCDSTVLIFGDTDVVVDPKHIIKTQNIMISQNISLMYPYNGFFVNVDGSNRESFIRNHNCHEFNTVINVLKPIIGFRYNNYSILHTNSHGGCVMFLRKAFIDINGYNPNFRGWGYEDSEILMRTSKLKHNIGRYNNKAAIAWHLDHTDVNGDKRDRSNPYYKDNQKISLSVEQMDFNSAKEYIKTWNI